MNILTWTFSERFGRYLESVARDGVPLERVGWHPMNEGPEGLRDRNGLHHYDHTTDRISIFLNSNLPTELAEVVAAHELAHEVLNRNAYPICTGSADPAIIDLATHINSALTDPSVNEYIKRFGYDPSPLYMPAVEAALYDWSTQPAGIEFDDINLKYNALVITNRHLQMSSEQWAVLKPLCISKSPKAFAVADVLIGIRSRYGYSSAVATIQTAIEWRSALRISGLLILLRGP